MGCTCDLKEKVPENQNKSPSRSTGHTVARHVERILCERDGNGLEQDGNTRGSPGRTNNEEIHFTAKYPFYAHYFHLNLIHAPSVTHRIMQKWSSRDRKCTICNQNNEA